MAIDSQMRLPYSGASRVSPTHLHHLLQKNGILDHRDERT